MIVQSVFRPRRNAILTVFTLLGASVMMPLSSYAQEDDLPSVEIHLENLDSLQKVTPVPVTAVHTKPVHMLKKIPAATDSSPSLGGEKAKLAHPPASIMPVAVKKEQIDNEAASVSVKKKMVEANAPTSGISRYLPLLPPAKETEGEAEAQPIGAKSLNKPLKSEATAKTSLFAVPSWVPGMGGKKKAELAPAPVVKEKTKTTAKIAKPASAKKKVATSASRKQTAKMERKAKIAAIARKKQTEHASKSAKNTVVKKSALSAKSSASPVKHVAAIPAKKSVVSNKIAPPIDDVVITETVMAEKPAAKSSLFAVPSWVPVIGEASKQGDIDSPKAVTQAAVTAEKPAAKSSLFAVPSWVPVIGEASKQADMGSPKLPVDAVPETKPVKEMDKKNKPLPMAAPPVKLAFESKKPEHPVAKKIDTPITAAQAVPVQKVTVTDVVDVTPVTVKDKPLPMPPMPAELPVVATPDVKKEAPIGLLIPGLPALPPPDTFQVPENGEVKNEEKYAAIPPSAAPAAVAPTPKMATIVPDPSSGAPMVIAPEGSLLLRLNYQDAVIAVPTEEKGRLADMVENVIKKKETHLSVVSYASGSEDNIGADRRISLQRAIELRKNLIAEGIDSERINVKAMGNNARDGSKDHVDIFAIE